MDSAAFLNMIFLIDLKPVLFFTIEFIHRCLGQNLKRVFLLFFDSFLLLYKRPVKKA